MNTINITMLGDFDIVVDGHSAITHIAKSPKSLLLLKYLLLNKGKGISVSSLIDALWSDVEDSANPESALKTMVSRIRANLLKASPVFQNCIVSKSGAYMWNDDIPCTVDIFQFEELCSEVQYSTMLDENNRETYIQILNIYQGDLSYASIEEEWVVSRSLYLRHLYFQTVYRFADLLGKVEDTEMIILVCRIALEIDPYDEKLNLLLMQALKRSGQTNAALMLYKHLMSSYYRNLGVEPSKKITDYYKQLIQTDYSGEANMNEIKKDLIEEEEGDEGALVCDYSIFKYIFHLQKRHIDRQKRQMYLALLSVLPEEETDPVVMDNAMKELMKILTSCLRKGDTVTRYSSSQYAMLLPMMNEDDGAVVIKRIKKMFAKACAGMDVTLDFQFGILEQEKAG